MYKFIIGDKEYSVGKLCLSNSELLAYEDQSVLKSLDGVNVLSCEVIDPVKTLVKNNALSHWSYKETLGRIAFNLSIAAETEDERLLKLSKVKSMLADESVIHITDTTGTKYYKGILLLGSIDDTLDTDSFNIIYGFNKDDVGVGLYPLAPSFLKTMLNNKNVTFTFTKGANAVTTKFVVNGTEYVTADQSITIALPNYGENYTVEIYSVSADGNLSEVTEKVVAVPNYVVIPTVPTNVNIVAVIGKYVTLSFTKGTDAYKTEITLGDIVTETFEEQLTILASAYNTAYDLKLRSISSTNGYSEYTDVIQVTTLEPIIPSAPTITNVNIEEDVVTFTFTKGTDAVSTEFIVDGVLYTTQDTLLVVDLGEYGKTFTYKARSISYTENYSDYTTEVSAMTDVIVVAPTNLSVSISETIATFTFTKATGAMTTEFIVDGATYTTDNNSLVVDIGAYSKSFNYKARSISTTGNYSSYTTESSASTGAEVIIPTAPTGLAVSINGKVATFTFTKGTNAATTEIIADGVTYSTSGTSIAVDIGTYSKTFNYKARSLSSTGNYSAYTTEFSAITGVEPIIPTVPTGLTVAISGTNATFTFTKGTNAVSTEFVVDGSNYSTSGTSLSVDIGAHSKTFTYKARSLSSTGNYSAYTADASATTDALPSAATLVAFNLAKKIAGSMDECPVKISVDDTEVSQAEYENAKGSVGVLNAEVVVDFTAFIAAYYSGSRTNFCNDLSAINLISDGGGYLFDFNLYEYKETKVSSITQSFTSVITSAKQLWYKIDNATDFRIELVLKTGITQIVPTVPTDLSVLTSGTVATFTFTQASDAISTELIVNGVTYTTSGTTLAIDIGAYSTTFNYKARSISQTGNYSDYTTEASSSTGSQAIIPTEPTGLSVSVSETVATFSFTKGTNAVLTEIVVNGVTHSTSGTSLSVDIGAYSTVFNYKARSLSSTGDYSAYTTEASSSTGVQAIIPTVPTGLAVAISGTNATFTFTKGTNATSTEFVVDGSTYTTSGTSLTVNIGAYSKTFTYKARSLSSTGNYSAYTADANATTGVQPSIGCALFESPAVKNNCTYGNKANVYSPKDFVNGAVIEVDSLVAMNANRYSVGASVINGILIER